MNLIAIDPSLSCTAMIVNDVKFVYTTEQVALTTKGVLNAWFTRCEPHVTARLHVNPTNDDHSVLEVLKLENYERIVTSMITDITANLIPGDITVAIEGYSYRSDVGPLIDLVTLGTLIRSGLGRMARNLGRSLTLKILQPTTVKLEAAKLAYDPRPLNKAGTKVEYRNHDGVAGGSFKKPEIYQALLDNKNLESDPWVIFLKGQWDNISLMKSIPKPIEDVNDAKTIYEILKAVR